MLGDCPTLKPAEGPAGPTNQTAAQSTINEAPEWVSVSRDSRSGPPSTGSRPTAQFVPSIPGLHSYSRAATQPQVWVSIPGADLVSVSRSHQVFRTRPECLALWGHPEPCNQRPRPPSPSRAYTTIRSRGGGKGVRPSSQCQHGVRAAPMRGRRGAGPTSS